MGTGAKAELPRRESFAQAERRLLIAPARAGQTSVYLTLTPDFPCGQTVMRRCACDPFDFPPELALAAGGERQDENESDYEPGHLRSRYAADDAARHILERFGTEACGGSRRRPGARAYIAPVTLDRAVVAVRGGVLDGGCAGAETLSRYGGDSVVAEVSAAVGIVLARPSIHRSGDASELRQLSLVHSNETAGTVTGTA